MSTSIIQFQVMDAQNDHLLKLLFNGVGHCKISNFQNRFTKMDIQRHPPPLIDDFHKLFLEIGIFLALLTIYGGSRQVCSPPKMFVAPGFKNKIRYTPYVSPESQISHIATNKGNINRQCSIYNVLSIKDITLNSKQRKDNSDHRVKTLIPKPNSSKLQQSGTDPEFLSK